MAGEVSGVDILLYVAMNDAEPYDFTIVGGQRGLTLNRTTASFDASHKSSGSWQLTAVGLLNWSVSGDAVKITDDATQARLGAIWRARGDVRIRVLKENGDAEEGMVFVADFSESAPHDNVATISLDLPARSPLVEVPSGS